MSSEGNIAVSALGLGKAYHIYARRRIGSSSFCLGGSGIISRSFGR